MFNLKKIVKATIKKTSFPSHFPFKLLSKLDPTEKVSSNAKFQYNIIHQAKEIQYFLNFGNNLDDH